MDWRRSEDLAERGYRATASMAASLEPFALSPSDYLAYRAARQRRRPGAEWVVRFVSVTGVPPSEQQAIRQAFSGHLHRPVDPDWLTASILAIAGTDRYECLTYRQVRGPDGPGLLVNVVPKSVRATLRGVGRQRGERLLDRLRRDAGRPGHLLRRRRPRLGGAARSGAWDALQRRRGVYCPLKASPWFVAPHTFVDRSTRNSYRQHELVAEDGLLRAGAGVDSGVTRGRRVEIRLGLEATRVRGRRRVGELQLPEVDGGERYATVQFAYEDCDNPMVPSRGASTRVHLRRFFQVPHATDPSETGLSAGPRRFWQGEVESSLFHRARGQDSVFVRAGAGTSFGDHPVLNDFSLGGPFRLGAFDRDELTGANYALGAAGYLKHLGRLPDIVGGSVYLGGWGECGSAFDHWPAAEWHTSLSGGLVLESILGPVFVGGSVTPNGRGRVFVALGPLLR